MSTEDLAGEDLAGEVWKAMRSLVTDHYDRRGEVAAALDMSFVRAKALMKLSVQEMSLGELATRLATDAPYVSLIVNDLETKGYVERTPHAEDRRSKIVRVTPDGRKVAETAERILNSPPPVISNLKPEDLEIMQRILTGVLPAGGI